MKLLVLAQTPPPVHGQSLMVQTLVTGLPGLGIEVHHINLGLSRDAADIGRWRPAKIAAVLDACLHAVVTRFRHGCDTLYYIPAPGKRGALYRDWVVMMLCRPFFKKLVLHWHAAGLGEWLGAHGTAPERWLTQRLLGRADLALVLGESLRADARHFRPRQITVLRNGIADPCPGFVRPVQPPVESRTAVFLGLCTEDKGLFDAIDGVRLANAQPAGPRWRLRVAGNFTDASTREKFAALADGADGWLHHEGFAGAEAKHLLLSRADALLFPTYYQAETQGLVVLEALAYDLPVVLTVWRAVAENLPAQHVSIVRPKSSVEIASALARLAGEPPPQGELRQHFLAHGTDKTFLLRFAALVAENLQE